MAEAEQNLPDWLLALASTFGEDPAMEDFLAVEMTAEQKRVFLERLQRENTTTYQRTWPSAALIEVASNLREILVGVRKSGRILVSSVDSEVGAVRMPAGALFVHAQAGWQIVREDLCLATPDFENGLYLEIGYVSESGEVRDEASYRLLAWGELVPQE